MGDGAGSRGRDGDREGKKAAGRGLGGGCGKTSGEARVRVDDAADPRPDPSQIGPDQVRVRFGFSDSREFG